MVGYHWEQVDDVGPNVAVFANASLAKANVTGLTKGEYQFRLTAVDNLGNEDSAVTSVTVSQDANMEPTAVAGIDYDITLPTLTISFNGSQSHDDFRITRWVWTRLSSSPAAGRIVGDTYLSPVLYMSDVVAGQYAFQLEVFDDQGKSAVDTATVTVKSNPDQRNVIRAVFNQDIESLTMARLDGIASSMALLLDNSGRYKISVLNLFPQQDSSKCT